MAKFQVPALLLFAISVFACTPAEEPAPPAPGSFAAAERSLRTGDLEGLRSNLGKGAGLSERMKQLRARLDPEAFLVASGAKWREHDVAATLRASSDAEMAAALGFSQDALCSDLLDAPSRLSAKYAGGMRYFRDVAAPLDLLAHIEPKALPSCAYVLRYRAKLSDRNVLLRAGNDGQSVSELFAREDGTEPVEGARGSLVSELRDAIAREPDWQPALGVALPKGVAAGANFFEFALIDESGTCFELEAQVSQGRWQILRMSRRSQAQRLEALRDSALRKLLGAALDFERRYSRWPAAAELELRESDFVDAAAQNGERGWAAYSKRPAVGLALAARADEEYAVRCLEGGRAITRSGTIIRLP